MKLPTTIIIVTSLHSNLYKMIFVFTGFFALILIGCIVVAVMAIRADFRRHAERRNAERQAGHHA